jgi:hypothetical protein
VAPRHEAQPPARSPEVTLEVRVLFPSQHDVGGPVQPGHEETPAELPVPQMRGEQDDTPARLAGEVDVLLADPP